jgi:two-component system phosphate regulon sensor histidine kinase PhoR
LERKRLSNWAQLAHDMQTNLSTIRLNAEQFDIEEGTNNANRRKKIIHQVGLLIQRVRDVVTVGRSDTINKELVDAYDICHEVRSEFDEAVFPNVSFAVDVQHFNIFCDKPKMIRAVRNAVENGIKSMQGKPGSIVITNWNDAKYAYIGVQDTGPGMDDKTMKKMLTPYFTTAKKSGGAGIGTMIMQHVMELHGGEIQVKSELGVGTQIVFCIPNYAHNKTSKAIADKVSSLRPEKN